MEETAQTMEKEAGRSLTVCQYSGREGRLRRGPGNEVR